MLQARVPPVQSQVQGLVPSKCEGYSLPGLTSCASPAHSHSTAPHPLQKGDKMPNAWASVQLLYWAAVHVVLSAAWLIGTDLLSHNNILFLLPTPLPHLLAQTKEKMGIQPSVLTIFSVVFHSVTLIFWEVLIADVLFRIKKNQKIRPTITTFGVLLFNNQVSSCRAEAAGWDECHVKFVPALSSIKE